MKITKKMSHVAAAAVLGFSLGAAGIASAAPGDASISTTGSHSWNTVRVNSDSDTRVNNNNRVNVHNTNPQTARSGDANAQYSTTSGDAMSGTASNDSSFSAHVTLSNTNATEAAMNNTGSSNEGSNSGSIDTTGYQSYNSVTFDNDTDVNVNNNNNVSVDNYNQQYASSGDARVSNNTTGGSATSGDATNTSMSDVTVSVSN